MKLVKTKRSRTSVIIEGLVLMVIMYFLFESGKPNFCKRVPRDYYQKQCFSNQRVISGAIDMYNMDHELMIHEFNEHTYKLLVEEKYLHNIKDYCECEYLVEGDLAVDGYIYCLNHGSPDRRKEGINPEASLHPKKDRKRELNENLIEFVFCTLPTIIHYLTSL